MDSFENTAAPNAVDVTPAAYTASTTAPEQETDSLYDRYVESGQYPRPDAATYAAWASAAQWRFRGWLPQRSASRCLDFGLRLRYGLVHAQGTWL